MCNNSTNLTDINDDFYAKLDSIFGNINDWLKFAEQKNAALLLLNGGIIWGVTRVLDKMTVTSMSSCFIFFAYVLTVASALICLTSFLPVLNQKWFKPKEKSPSDNCLYFAHAAKYGANDYLKLLAKKLNYENSKTEFTEFEVDLAKQIVTNSEIALDKYNKFKLATYCTIFAVVVFLLSIGIIKFME